MDPGERPQSSPADEKKFENPEHINIKVPDSPL